MLNQNRYTRISESASVLLVEDLEEDLNNPNSYKVVLHDQNLLIARPSEIEIQ